MNKHTDVSIEGGVETIRKAAKKLPESPGVYRMLDNKGEVLYVGKAKALKKRVLSYTYANKLSNRIKRMVAATKAMEFVHTHTEVEALLLESNLIKKFQPRFNVLLRDSKSYPYIYISAHKSYPQIASHRGAKSRDGKYFGPFASAGPVYRTINALQRAFMIRNCSDSYFSARKRPCLQYHIKRCTAPCVSYVSEEDYAEQVAGAIDFLSGSSREVQEKLAKNMQSASDNLEFEKAARYRDRIRALSAIQSRQDINLGHIKDADVIGLTQDSGASCIQVFFFRGGQNFGNRAFFPRHQPEEAPKKILSAFIAQFYNNKPVPKEIFVSHDIEEKELLTQALEQSADLKIDLRRPQRGEGRRIMEFVLNNARDALKRHLAEKMGQEKLLVEVARIFDLEEPPQRIEVYDNSHISGENMVGAMIVATPEGFQKNSYRKFNIREAARSDDFGMMREVLKRRFANAIKEHITPEDETWPDLILIDGGKGQLSSVIKILEELNIKDNVTVAAISKGPDRNAGREIIHMPDRAPVMLKEKDPALHYLQRIRDEAHRFAIGAHRQKRQKGITQSPLDEVPGIGAKRKKALLLHFGSAREVKRAGLNDLCQVEGISKSVAQTLYNYFHDG